MSYLSARELDFQKYLSAHGGDLLIIAHAFGRNVVQSDVVRCLFEVDLVSVFIRDEMVDSCDKEACTVRRKTVPKMLTILLPSADRGQELIYAWPLDQLDRCRSCPSPGGTGYDDITIQTSIEEL